MQPVQRMADGIEHIDRDAREIRDGPAIAHSGLLLRDGPIPPSARERASTFRALSLPAIAQETGLAQGAQFGLRVVRIMVDVGSMQMHEVQGVMVLTDMQRAVRDAALLAAVAHLLQAGG